MATTAQPAVASVAAGGAQSARGHRSAPRWIAAMLAATAGLALTVSAVSPASASTFGMQSAAAGAAASAGGVGKVCTVRATGFVKRGTTNLVTSTVTSCHVSGAGRQAAQSLSALSNVHVGYGCNGVSFTSTCWYFDVPSPGCAGSSSWGWDTIVQNNVLSSWEAVGTCSHGTLYDLPVYGGTHIVCYTCYSLGSMDNKATSLKVFR